MDLLDALVDGIDAALPRAASLRRAIHANPHLGGDEHETRETFMAETQWLDWIPVAETGAYARTGPPGPAVGLRAELDALPIHESTGLAWASQRRGIMHACGHDVHLAALYALLHAARGLDLPAAMVAILQPREETTPPGACDVVASGVLEDAEVRAMVAVHVQPQVERGVISTGSGPVNAAFDAFEIVVTGHMGHGAYPHQAINPIGALAAIVDGLGSLTATTVDPIQPAVLSIGSLRAGTAPNIIPESATLAGTVRTFYPSDRAAMFDAITRLAEGVALSRGATATTTFTRGGPTLSNDAALSRCADELLTRLGIPVAQSPFRSCGSDDFSEYSEVAPSLMSFIGTGFADGVGLHHPRFLPGRDSLRLSAIALAVNYVAAATTIAEDAATE